MAHKELNRLKLLLVEKKKTGLWLAEQLGKDKITISKWCTNSSQLDVECLIKISKLLNVELSDILIVDNEEI
ncbi:MAG: helix-turn-helix transcriptional regulator [Prevotella sp.]|nr:helix-turn-helix transcriptional regulator [Prevotella sp.]MEE1205642.1 helix-turn-helix transcriptional regulator [Prevotella sp.]